MIRAGAQAVLSPQGIAVQGGAVKGGLVHGGDDVLGQDVVLQPVSRQLHRRQGGGVQPDELQRPLQGDAGLHAHPSFPKGHTG